MQDNAGLVTIRPFEEGDKNFILATFLRGLYYGDTWFKEIPKNIFMESYHKVAERLVSSPSVTIAIACLKDDPEVILGYSIFRKTPTITVLDYVFVKAAWRKIGIAKSLVPERFDVVTHLTRVGKTLKPANVVFNPFLL